MSEKHIYFCPACASLRNSDHDGVSMVCDCGADALRMDAEILALRKELDELRDSEIQALRSDLALMTAERDASGSEMLALQHTCIELRKKTFAFRECENCRNGININNETRDCLVCGIDGCATCIAGDWCVRCADKEIARLRKELLDSKAAFAEMGAIAMDAQADISSLMTQRAKLENEKAELLAALKECYALAAGDGGPYGGDAREEWAAQTKELAKSAIRRAEKEQGNG